MSGALARHVALAALLCALVGCGSPVATGRIDANRPFKILPRGHVGMNQAVYVGEVPQFLDIRGRSDKQPVLLYIHEPGRSALPTAHVYGGSLERRFLVVHWDQRGTHRSHVEELERFPLDLDRLVADTVELAGLLAEWFHKEKILLVAEGLGALPAVLAAKAAPERFFGLVLLAPVVDVQGAQAHAHQWALDQGYAHGPREALQALQDLGDRPWPNDKEAAHQVALSGWVDALGGTVPGTDARALWHELASQAPRPRSLRTELAAVGEAYSLERLWPAMRGAELKALAPTLDVPVFFLVGEADQRAPIAQAQAYYEALDARQGKTLVRLEGVGHWPLLQAPDRVLEFLGGRVWPLGQ